MPRTEKALYDGWEFAFGEPADFQQIIIPHDWVIHGPIDPKMDRGASQGYRGGYGIGWYRRKLEVKPRPNMRYYLDFDGIFENSTIWVNQREVGGHPYGYSPFLLEVTDDLIEGENELLIRVDASRMPKDRWYSGAGLYRTVRWIETERKHFTRDDIVVRTFWDKEQARIQIDTGVQAHVRAVLDGHAAEGESGTVEIEMDLEKAHLWSVENPYLYSLRLELWDEGRIWDILEMRIGLREVELKPGKGLYINKERVILKGVCLHQDAGSRGIAVKKELWRERLMQLKEMSCNAIRPAHHMHSREFMDLCDELGFYVYEECFDKWKSGAYARYFDTQWRQDVEAMIRRDRNRPSVIMWSVGNEVENQGQNSMLEILKALSEYVRSLDPTRAVSYAMNPHFKRESGIDASQVADIQKFVDEVDDREIYDLDEKIERICRIGALVDVICCNYQEQWYPKIHEAMPEKLILGTEVYQYFQGAPEQFQNYSEKLPVLVPEQYEYVIGSMIWTGFDYLGEAGQYPSKGWSGSPIRTNGVRKPMYYILKSIWNPDPMVYFAVMDYSLEDDNVKEHWDVPPYASHWYFPQFHRTVIPYMIASNCDEVILYLNGKRHYLPRPSECSNGLITGFLPWQKGEVRVIGLIAGEEVCEYMVRTPQEAVRMRFAQEETELAAEKGLEKMLLVRSEDERGTVCYRESALVRFRIEGPARIIAVDNGNLMSTESYDSDRIHLYHGQAGVLIRLDGQCGRIKLYADAQGMFSAQTVITVV